MAILASHAMQPAQQAVEHYGWLKPGEMLDGLGMAETTPGPLIMVLQFVGFMAAYREPGSLAPILAGTLGGLLATWVTFTPCFLWIFLGAPFVEKLRGNKGLNAVRLARERVDGVPPRSTFDFPVSHHPKIHSADQIGSVCLGGFHVGHSLLQSTRV
jgi:Chromate transporter